MRTFLIILFLPVGIVSLTWAAALHWDASTGIVDGYTVYTGVVEGEYITADDAGNVTVYELMNLTLYPGVQYFFMVRAYNTTGESGDSNVAGFTTPPYKLEDLDGDKDVDGSDLARYINGGKLSELPDLALNFGSLN